MNLGAQKTSFLARSLAHARKSSRSSSTPHASLGLICRQLTICRCLQRLPFYCNWTERSCLRSVLGVYQGGGLKLGGVPLLWYALQVKQLCDITIFLDALPALAWASVRQRVWLIVYGWLSSMTMRIVACKQRQLGVTVESLFGKSRPFHLVLAVHGLPQRTGDASCKFALTKSGVQKCHNLARRFRASKEPCLRLSSKFILPALLR